MSLKNGTGLSVLTVAVMLAASFAWAQNPSLPTALPNTFPAALPPTLTPPPPTAALQAPATATAEKPTDSQPLLPTPVSATAKPTAPATPTANTTEKPVESTLMQDVADKEKAEKELADKLAAEAAKKPALTNDKPLPVSEPGAPLPQDIPSEPSANNTIAGVPQIPLLPLNSIDQVAANIDPNQLGPNNNAPRTQEEYDALLKQRQAELAVQARAQAWQQTRDTMMPMKPEEIRELLNLLRASQEATQKPVASVAVPKVAVETLNLDPATPPPVVRLATGNVTSLTILDQTGQPWPIGDMAFAGPFDIKQPEAGGHVVRITPMKEFARGNISLRMLNLATPLTFALEAGGDVVHYRFDARVPQPGPNAATPLIADGSINVMAGTDPTVSAVLAGIPPQMADKMTVDGADARTTAYHLNGRLYVRTPLNLLSPTWQSSAQSADGMKVYVLDNAPVLLLSDQGTMVRATLKKALVSTSGLFDTTGAPRS